MKLRLVIVVVALQVVVGLSRFDISHSIITLPLLSSVMVLSSQGDFESMVKALDRPGVRTTAPASLAGKSGVRHEFAVAVQTDSSKPKVVVDTALSIGEVDEMKVLAFYVKVFDVSPEKAILCVCPFLGEKAKLLAQEYRITVIEDEQPRKLVSLATEAVKTILGER